MSGALYDEIANWYDSYISTGSAGILNNDLVLPNVLDLLGDVKDKSILDLACGQGIVSREIARLGARVVGIDISVKLLEIAKEKEQTEPLGITYQHDDAQKLAEIKNNQFDAVVCNLAIMDIVDLNAVFQSVRRVLNSKGFFVVSITHPCFQPPFSRWEQTSNGETYRAVSHYFEEGPWRSENPQGVRFRVGANHRTLSTYLNNLIEQGFEIQKILEPQGTPPLTNIVPGYVQTPAVLIVKAGVK